VGSWWGELDEGEPEWEGMNREANRGRVRVGVIDIDWGGSGVSGLWVLGDPGLGFSRLLPWKPFGMVVG